MIATLQVVECDENRVAPKTWRDFPQRGSYMPGLFWAVDRAGNISPVNYGKSFTHLFRRNRLC